MMKVFEMSALGIENLRPAERPQPKPGHGQVVLKMLAFSLNFRDLLVVKGLYNPKLTFPCVPFSDGVGEVDTVGEGVSRVKVGDRVCPIFMQQWLAGELTEAKSKSSLGGGGAGLLAEFVALDQEGLVPAPAHLSNEEAATLPCAAVTAWQALVTEGKLTAGDTVLVQGTGGVSLFALQFARMSGARVIATSSSDDKLARAKQLGAHEGINYKTMPEWGDKARALTLGVGVDHVVEVGGAGTIGQSLRAVRPGGRISLIGVLAGTGSFGLTPILMKKVCVQGIYVGSREMFEAMNRAISLHQTRPVIDKVFGWGDVQAALKHMESASHFGKICVKVV